MRILLITSSFPHKGRVAGLFLPDLIAELNGLGFQVHVLTQNCDKNKTESRNLWEGCKVTSFAWTGGEEPLINLTESFYAGVWLCVQFFFNGVRSGRRIVKEWKPHFIFAEWLLPSGFIALIISYLSKIPYGARALGSDVLIGGKKPIIKNLLGIVARHAAVVFADGFMLCEKTSELAGGKKCYFAPTSRKMKNTKSNFKHLNDAGFFTTCTVARLHHIKGHEYLVNAVRILRDKGIAIRSYIVGNGEEHDYLSKLIAELGLQDRVILTGKLEDGDIVDLLDHIDCVVIPSLSESIPLALSEAIGAGKPLVVTDAGDMEFIVQKYNLGYVVPKQDEFALANAIEKMEKNHERSRFTEQSNKVLNLLSVENAARTIARQFSMHYSHEKTRKFS